MVGCADGCAVAVACAVACAVGSSCKIALLLLGSMPPGSTLGDLDGHVVGRRVVMELES